MNTKDWSTTKKESESEKQCNEEESCEDKIGSIQCMDDFKQTMKDITRRHYHLEDLSFHDFLSFYYYLIRITTPFDAQYTTMPIREYHKKMSIKEILQEIMKL